MGDHAVGMIEMGLSAVPVGERSFIYKAGRPPNLGTAVGLPDMTYTPLARPNSNFWQAKFGASLMGGSSFLWHSAVMFKMAQTSAVGAEAWANPGGNFGFSPTGSTSATHGGFSFEVRAGLNKSVGLPVWGFSESQYGGFTMVNINGTYVVTEFPVLPPQSVGEASNLDNDEWILVSAAGVNSRTMYRNGVLYATLSGSNPSAGLITVGMSALGILPEVCLEGIANWRNTQQAYTPADFSRLRAEFDTA